MQKGYLNNNLVTNIHDYGIFLVRHGTTAWNISLQYCGRSDIALNDEGREQARRIADFLSPWPIAKIYTSPALRARESASFLANKIGLSPDIKADLRESDYGKWEGLTVGEIKKQYPDNYRQWSEDPAQNSPLEGEPGLLVYQRVQCFLTELLSKPAEQQAYIAVYSHQTALRTFLAALMNKPVSEYRTIRLVNGSISFIDYQRRVIFYNYTGHLE